MPDTAAVDAPSESELSSTLASLNLTTEKALSDSWRVSVKHLAALRQRKLRRGFHWEIHHYTVCYTRDGVERLKDLMSEGLSTGEVELKPEKEDLHTEALLRAKWRVVRIPPNPRMVLLRNEWSGENLWLYVTNHRNFKKNLIVQDSDIAPPDALNQRHLRRKPPRFYGRW